MERTKNSFLNIVTSLISSMLLIVLSFISRSCLIHFLGTSYLGIEGLFSNILSMLSLAELGFGWAIVFKLYKPIEENNQARIRILMKLYKKVYQMVGLAVFVVGVCLIPFLPSLVKDYGKFAELHLNATIVFLIYLLNSASSYWFFAYKASFINANQKTYKLTIFGYGISILTTVSQIVALAVIHSFLAYVVVQLVFTILTNSVYALICDHMYPYLREETTDCVSRQEIKEFIHDCSCLMLYKMNDVVINASDNIVLSAFVGLDAVGLYANYLSINWAIRSVLSKFFDSIKAPLGSLYSTGNLNWSRLIYRVVSFLTFWLYGIAAIGAAVLTDEFITLWLGSEYVVSSWTFAGTTISTPLGVLIGIEIYIVGQRLFFAAFRGAMGLYRQTRYRPILSMTVNLVVVLLTVCYLGPAGCVIGTIVSAVTTNFIYDPIVIQKHGLRQSPKQHFRQSLFYKLVTLFAGAITWIVCKQILISGVLGFVVRGCICVFLPSTVFALCFARSVEFHYVFRVMKQVAVKGVAVVSGKTSRAK